MKQINADRPKDSREEDKLGYAPFAQAVAKAIRLIRSDEGLVLALHGPWGSGKTSAVNMVVEELKKASEAEQSQKPIIIRFNPWWFSGQQDLTKVFFSELSIALHGKGLIEAAKGLKKVAQHVVRNREAFLGLVDLIPVPGTNAVKAVLGTAGDALEQALENEKTLDQERDALCDALKKQGRRILVIVDDLDRLPADEARQIFRLVKSVADLPKITYLLVFDRSIVKNALQGDVSADGPHWLEKIVQASFDLPPIQKLDLQDFFFGALKEAVGDVAEQRDTHGQYHWNHLYQYAIEPWLKTPRDAIRLCNALSVTYPPVADEVNFADFVALETLRLFEPEVYNVIRNNQSDLTSSSLNSNSSEIDNEIMEKELNNINKQIKTLLSIIFPILSDKLRISGVNINEIGPSFCGADHLAHIDAWINQRRCYIDRHFPTYFTFTAGKDVITRGEWGTILEAFQKPDTAQALIQDYRQRKSRSGRERGQLLLDELRRNVGDIPSEQLGPTLQTFLHVADDFLTPDAPSRYDQLVLSAADALIDRLSGEEREDAISNALSSASKLKLLTRVISALSEEHGHSTTRRAYPEHQRRVSERAVLLLETNLCEKLTAAADSGTLLEQPEEMTFWFHLAGKEKAKAYTDDWLKDDQSCLHLANVATHVLSKEQRSWLELFLDIDQLATRLDAIRPNADRQQQEIIDRFKEAARH